MTDINERNELTHAHQRAEQEVVGDRGGPFTEAEGTAAEGTAAPATEQGTRVVLGTNRPNSTNVQQNLRGNPKGRTSLRKRSREKSRREQFNIELGLMADVLVRIDPSLREGGTNGTGSSVRNRVDLLETAIEKLRSIHEENEANKRKIDELIGEGATMPTAKRRSAPSNEVAPESVGSGSLKNSQQMARRVQDIPRPPLSQLGTQTHREEVLSQPNWQVLLAEQGYAEGYSVHSDFSSRGLQGLPAVGHRQLLVPPLAVPMRTVSNESVQRGLDCLNHHNGNHLVALRAAVAEAEHRRRLALLLQSTTMMRSNLEDPAQLIRSIPLLYPMPSEEAVIVARAISKSSLSPSSLSENKLAACAKPGGHNDHHKRWEE